jgi:hypothetical protein
MQGACAEFAIADDLTPKDHHFSAMKQVLHTFVHVYCLSEET